jgi:hypothetical protein
MAADDMNAAAQRFAGQGVGSIFLYTNEAHPGEYYPHLTSMDQKFRHAAALRDVLGVNRSILLDALDGVCHRAYGSMPNMTWIFDRSGKVLYKADWTSTESVVRSLEYFLEIGERRKTNERLAPFQVARVEYREVDRQAFYDRLAENGPKAVEEFKKAF